jgi:hypothetical protein
VAKQFLDTVENGADSKSLANLHNNEAGRIVSLIFDVQLNESHINVSFLVLFTI